jgi:Alginate lyase
VTGTPAVTATGTNAIGTGRPGRAAQLTGGGGACRYPADVLDLGGFSLGLPTGGVIDQLATYTADPWFVATADCTGVRFRAAVNGDTTASSNYPRSALRDKTTWSSTSGTHTLTVRTAVTQQPAGTPHVVVAQVHDANDDLATFRLEGGTLYLTNGNEAHYRTVGSVGLGTTFEVRFVVGGGEIKAYYGGTLVGTISRSFSGGYFQAGAFTQANCDNSAPCSASNYGETVIRGLSVAHTG